MYISPKLPPRGDTRRPHWTTLLLLVCALCVMSSACDGTDTPTSPTTDTPTTEPAPTVTDDFSGTVAVGGYSFYSFSVAVNGTVSATLISVGGAGVPGSVWMGLGLGTPSGEDCATTSGYNGPAGSSPQLTGTYVPGVYCVKIHDLGNLAAPAQFAISIVHP